MDGGGDPLGRPSGIVLETWLGTQEEKRTQYAGNVRGQCDLKREGVGSSAVLRESDDYGRVLAGRREP